MRALTKATSRYAHISRACSERRRPRTSRLSTPTTAPGRFTSASTTSSWPRPGGPHSKPNMRSDSPSTRQFVYLIQDYEPLLHPASTPQALAEETYTLDHIPIVNSDSLFDFLVQQGIGRFADSQFASRALVFQPAVDRTVFHPPASAPAGDRRRLLFYARPTNGLRNLFEIGVAALQKVLSDGTFAAEEWEFLGMGESFAPRELGGGAILAPAPWLDLAGYARQMRESDILLSLMLSPHPSYPPLEMAASAGLVVTTAFANKSSAWLRQLSDNIIGAAPSVEDVAGALAQARARLSDWPKRMASAAIDLPHTWDDSLAGVVPVLVTRLLELQGSPALPPSAVLQVPEGTPSVHPTFRSWPRSDYELLRREHLRRRAHAYPAIERPGLLSFLTPVWNTDPGQLEELAESILGQDVTTNHEWVVVDNASDRTETKAVLDRLARDARVRLYRSDTNLGIIGGTRFCLERATGRYAATVDHDDLLAPDCVRVITHALVSAGYPTLAYTDEDKVEGSTFRDPYFKGDWDPVLFTTSCYIAHLIMFDRERALRARCLHGSTDRGVPRLGHVHQVRGRPRDSVPHSRRSSIPGGCTPSRRPGTSIRNRTCFPPSAASSPSSCAASAEPERYKVEPSALFNGSPDWRIRRVPRLPVPITTILIGGDATVPVVPVDSRIPHALVQVPDVHATAALRAAVRECIDGHRLVHLLTAGTGIDGTEWMWDAISQFELFPDTAIVGGRITRHGRVLSAASYFGFGRGCDSPDRGRSTLDPGFFAQMWKVHSASAVPLHHCVVDPVFLDAFLAAHRDVSVAMPQLGAWMGAFAQTSGRRVIYSPFLTASADIDLEGVSDDLGWATFRRVHWAAIPDTRYLSSRLGLDHATAYQRGFRGTRRAQLIAADRDRPATALDADRAARSFLVTPAQGRASFSLLTSVYSRTPPATLRPDEQERARAGARLRSVGAARQRPDRSRGRGHCLPAVRDARIKVIREPVNVGIVGAMQPAARGKRRANTLSRSMPTTFSNRTCCRCSNRRLPRRAWDFVYADESIRSGDETAAIFSRPPFDPVLNLETSYIWHPCAFRRILGWNSGSIRMKGRSSATIGIRSSGSLGPADRSGMSHTCSISGGRTPHLRATPDRRTPDRLRPLGTS